MSPETGPQFMDKFDLHKVPEVEKSTVRLRGEGEKIPETKGSRIEAHFRRIERALEGKRGLFTHIVKDKLFQSYTINLQNEDGSENTERIDQLIQGLFDSEKEILRRRGMGAELDQYGDKPTSEDHEKYRQQIYDKKREQEKTLGAWIDYLGSEEANFYPIWFKYLALRSLQRMGRRDRDTEEYSKRSANTLQPFPDLSREALALTLDAILRTETDSDPNAHPITQSEETIIQENEAETEIRKLAEKGDFAKLYAHFQGEIERAKREKGESTAGEWIHYPKGSSPETLCKTLEGKGTEWCTAGLDVASNQLQSGEFYIYYTYDKDQKPADPRIAVYLINGEISEVRGVYGKDQDLELDFVDIAREKYKDFPGSERYEKKDHDMKQLTAIERKTKHNLALTREELIFLYEIDSKIEGFGHGSDPRVKEIRDQRNTSEDAPIVLDCQPEEIAWGQDQINQNTKAYIGPLFPGIFDLPNLEDIYTSFPEGKIRKDEFVTCGKNGSELLTDLEAREIIISDYAKSMLQSPEFADHGANETILTVRLKVFDLFPDGRYHTYDEIITKARELGLTDTLPHETASDLLLNESTQPNLGEWYSVASKQITDRHGYPNVFNLERSASGLYLDDIWASPSSKWDPNDELMFGLRPKPEQSSV